MHIHQARALVYELIAFSLAAISLCSHPKTISAREQRQSPSPCDTSTLCPGEELVYEVSWLKVKLGQIRLKALESTTGTDGSVRYNCVAYVDSYDELPFLDVHAVSHTEMNARFFSTGFHAVEKKDDDRWLAEKSSYDLPHDMIVIEKVFQKEKNSLPFSSPTRDTVHLTEEQIQDGLSIFYFARANVRRRESMTVPTVIYGKKGRMLLQFSGVPAFEEIDALENQRVSVVQLDGKAEFRGMFGFTGKFRGWFSDDHAAIPIKAELEVTLGSVKLELVKWKRTGWSPPAIPKK